MRKINNRAAIGGVLIFSALAGCLFISTKGSASPATSASPNDLSACEAVAWTNIINVTAAGNSIQKTGGVPYTWDAGAVSTRGIQSGDGYVQITMDALNGQKM